MKTEKRKSAPVGKLAIGALILTSVFAWQRMAYSAEEAVSIAAPKMDIPAGNSHSAQAVFSGGCFWGVQGVFEHVRGVTQVVSGYSGGAASTADYETVSTGETGHAESVQITYDPTKVSYGQLLQVFFSVAHNPTELNYQGPDHGTQYRSAIFPLNDRQRQVAAEYIDQLNKAHAFSAPIVTKLEPFKGFYRAEDYHQDFLVHNPDHPYIRINDLPKIKDLQRLLPADYQPNAVLVAPASPQV